MLFGRLFFLAKYLDAADKLNPASVKSLRSFFISKLLKYILLLDFSFPLTTTVISPITSLFLKKSITSQIVSPICCSNFLVNSRETLISLDPPQYSSNS